MIYYYRSTFLYLMFGKLHLIPCFIAHYSLHLDWKVFYNYTIVGII